MAIAAVMGIAAYVHLAGQGSGGVEKAQAHAREGAVVPQPKRTPATSSRAAPRYVASKVVPVGARAFVIQTTMPFYEGDGLPYVEQRLAASQRGNGQATYEIHLAVSNCRRLLSPGSDADFSAYASMGMGGEYLKGRKRELLFCESLATRDDLMGRDWLGDAAAQGSLEAQLLYAIVPEDVLGGADRMLSQPERIVEYKRKAVGYLQTAAAGGSVDALGNLKDVYEIGILAPRDPVRAAAYAAAEMRARSQGDPQEAFAKAGLTPEQRKTATEMAETIYRGCCR